MIQETGAKPLPQDVDMQVLRLAADSYPGVQGRRIHDVVSILRDRAIPREAVYESVRILDEERGWVTVTSAQPRRKSQRLNYADRMIAITLKGRDALRHLEANTQFNVRIPEVLARELQEYAGQAGVSMSAAAIRFIEEGVRTAKFPGVDFRWTPTGRVAHVTGTGLSVWEMFAIWRDHKGDMARIRHNYPPYTPAQITVGAAYAKAYIHEMPPRPSMPPFAREFRVS